MPRNTVAADTGDTLGVVAETFDSIDHVGDTLQTEFPLVLGVEREVRISSGGLAYVTAVISWCRPG